MAALVAVNALAWVLVAVDAPVLAYTAVSPSETLLNELANTTDELRLSDFELVSTDQSATALQMLDDDEAQLAVLWEPDVSTARNTGHTLVLSSGDVPDSIVDVIVVSDRLIERDPAAVQALVSSYYEAMDGYLADDEALHAFYAEDSGLDATDTAALIEGIRLYGSEDADEFMNQAIFPLDTPQIEQSRDSIGSVLALIHPDIQLDLADTDGSFVRALVDPRHRRRPIDEPRHPRPRPPALRAAHVARVGHPQPRRTRRRPHLRAAGGRPRLLGLDRRRRRACPEPAA